MKILLIGPGNQPGRTECYITRAFRRAGHTVSVFDNLRWYKCLGRSLNAALRAQAAFFHPDLVFFTRARHCDPELVNRLCQSRRSACWYFDAPREIPESLLQMARGVDTLFITSDGQREEYRRRGVRNVLFLPQACDAELHRMAPAAEEHEYRLSFVGTIGKNSYRDQFLREVAARMPLHVWGKNEPQDGGSLVVHRTHLYDDSLSAVIGRSFAILGVNYYEHMNDIRRYASNRIWLTLGCGGFFIGYRAPSFDEVVPEGVYAEYFSSPDELLEKVSYYRENPAQRDAIRKRAYEWVHRNHTYDNRIRNVLASRSFFEEVED